MRKCCFIGHRKVNDIEKLKRNLITIIEGLIRNDVRIFLYGSRSQFNDICLEVITDLKEKYPFIARIYVRAEYEFISSDYKAYLLNSYDDTYFSNKAKNSGKFSYIKRNEEIIDSSEVCIIYFDWNYKSATNQNSGTKLAYHYAQKRNKTIINLFEM